MANSVNQKLADFGSGCFWGTEAEFRKVPGVLDVKVGYEGGTLENPTYRAVCTDTTGHAEVVRITFDSAVVNYSRLLAIFFDTHDPTTLNHQGPDYGTQYRSIIFYHSPRQKALAEAEIARRNAGGDYADTVVTAVEPAKTFYPAEEYHQRYFEKQGISYSCHLGNGKKPGRGG